MLKPNSANLYTATFPQGFSNGKCQPLPLELPMLVAAQISVKSARHMQGV